MRNDLRCGHDTETRRLAVDLFEKGRQVKLSGLTSEEFRSQSLAA